MSISKIQQEIQQKLKQDYFTLFSLPISFSIDNTALKKAMLNLQKQYHPDNYQGNSTMNAAEEDILVLSSTINHAYQVLLNPGSRAIYLLQLYKITIPEENQTTHNPELLLQQMELRQRIDQAFSSHNSQELDMIEEEIVQQSQQLEDQIAALFEQKHYDQVFDQVQILLFYQKARNMLVEG